ncbi:unnamed protein product, partial [Iphiclides podalirius]
MAAQAARRVIMWPRDEWRAPPASTRGNRFQFRPGPIYARYPIIYVNGASYKRVDTPPLSVGPRVLLITSNGVLCSAYQLTFTAASRSRGCIPRVCPSRSHSVRDASERFDETPRSLCSPSITRAEEKGLSDVK